MQCLLPPKCKTPHIPYPTGLYQYNSGLQDTRPTIRVSFGAHVSKTPIYSVMSWFPLFVALCDHNPPTLLTDIDGRRAHSITSLKSPLQTARRTWSLDDSLPLTTALGCCCCCWSVSTRSFSALGVRLRRRGLLDVDDVTAEAPVISTPPTSSPPIRTRRRATCSTPEKCYNIIIIIIIIIILNLRISPFVSPSVPVFYSTLLPHQGQNPRGQHKGCGPR